jgi:hypothetical protein
MSKGMGYRIIFTLVCMFVFVSIATAHEVSILHRAKVGNGPELQQGTYRVEVVKNENSSQVRFYRGKSLVLEVPAKLVKTTTKQDPTHIHYDQTDGGYVITEIGLQGRQESLVFNEATPAKAE